MTDAAPTNAPGLGRDRWQRGFVYLAGDTHQACGTLHAPAAQEALLSVAVLERHAQRQALLLAEAQSPAGPDQ